MASFALIETGRLLLRKLHAGDSAALFAYRSRPEVFRYQSFRPQKLEEAEEFIRGLLAVEPDTPGTWLQLAVCLKDTGKLIGDAGMHFPEDDASSAEIGYTISPEHQGRGYATETIRAMLEYLLNTLGKRKVVASVDPRNTPSIAVLEKAGFRLEARFEKSFYMDGEWCDDAVYSISNTVQSPAPPRPASSPAIRV